MRKTLMAALLLFPLVLVGPSSALAAVDAGAAVLSGHESGECEEHENQQGLSGLFEGDDGDGGDDGDEGILRILEFLFGGNDSDSGDDCENKDEDEEGLIQIDG